MHHVMAYHLIHTIGYYIVSRGLRHFAYSSGMFVGHGWLFRAVILGLITYFCCWLFWWRPKKNKRR